MVNWDIVAKLEEEGGAKPMFPSFNRDTHVWRYTSNDGITKLDKDITRKVAMKKMGGMPRGFRWRYIMGVDPNGSVPNFAVIFKVFAPLKRGEPNRWVAWDIVKAKGHCGHLGKTVKQAGYSAKDVLIVPDFSSRYNRLGNPRASSALLRAEGFYVVNRPKNPKVKASIDDVQAKLDPVEGAPSVFLRLPECGELADGLEAAVWNKDGNGFDKSVRVDIVDAFRYPISFFEPSVRLEGSRIKVQAV